MDLPGDTILNVEMNLEIKKINKDDMIINYVKK